MEISANTTRIFPRFLSALSALFIRPARASAAVFSLYVPGDGLSGDFATMEEAETAYQRLPYAVRQRATITDADGYCVRC